MSHARRQKAAPPFKDLCGLWAALRLAEEVGKSLE
jgi:hypothetical protein